MGRTSENFDWVLMLNCECSLVAVMSDFMLGLKDYWNMSIWVFNTKNTKKVRSRHNF